MSHLRHLLMLTRYKAWANELTYGSFTVLSDDELRAKRAVVFGSILRSLNHVYCMDVVWKAHLQGVPHHFTTRNPETPPPFAELREAQRSIDAWYIEQAEALTDESAREVVDFTFIGGDASRMTREEIYLHVINHGTYHRGHLSMLAYQTVGHGPANDLPVFLREAARVA
jgi:uncharacterized damage-inducible protein DinB